MSKEHLPKSDFVDSLRKKDVERHNLFDPIVYCVSRGKMVRKNHDLDKDGRCIFCSELMNETSESSEAQGAK